MLQPLEPRPNSPFADLADELSPRTPALENIAPAWIRLAPCVYYLIVEFARPMGWVPALAPLRLGLISIALSLLVVLFFRPRPIPKLMYPMLILTALMAWHVPFAKNNAFALWGFQDFAILILGGVLPLATLPVGRDETRLIVWAYVLVHVPTAIHTLMYRGVGPGGWLGDENDVALALVAAIGVSIYLLLVSRSLGKRLVLIGFIGLAISGVVWSMSRGGFLGLAALFLLILLLGPNRRLVVALAVLAAIALFLFAPPQFWVEVESIGTAHQEGDTGEARFYYWRLALRIFADNPILGVGQRNYGIHAPDYQDPLLDIRQDRRRHMWGRASHSMYLDLISEQGLVGLFLFVWMLRIAARDYYSLRGSWVGQVQSKQHRLGLIACGLIAGAGGVLAAGSFLSVLYYPVLWVLLALLSSCAAARAAATGESVA